MREADVPMATKACNGYFRLIDQFLIRESDGGVLISSPRVEQLSVRDQQALDIGPANSFPAIEDSDRIAKQECSFGSLNTRVVGEDAVVTFALRTIVTEFFLADQNQLVLRLCFMLLWVR